ncbi:flavodoxin domain-containing protein [Chloroflexota bacterium]
MNTVIIYRSFFGAAKRYAELLHGKIESDIDKYNRIDERSLLKYDLVILCAGTYAGWISLGGYLKKHWNVLKDRKVILLVIGAAPVDAPWSIRSYEKIPAQIRQGIKYFKLPSPIYSREVDKARKGNLTPVIEYIKGVTP